MKFSIVIPCYNEEHNLPFLLSSIKKLNYPREEIEVIVVDNNCTDRTVEIAKSFKVDKIVREQKPGLTWARQRGFLVSDGQIIYNVDADCELIPDALKIIEKYLNDQKIVAVSGPYDYCDLNKIFRVTSLIFQNLIYPIVPKIINLFFRKKAALIIGGNTAIKKEVLYKIKGFDTSVKFWGEDVLLAFRLAKVGKVVFSKKLKVYTSGRRFKNDGYLKTIIRYFLNYFWLYFFNKPFVKE